MRPQILLLRWKIKTYDLWHRSATWPWFTVLFLGGIAFIAVNEFVVGLILIGSALISLVSRLWHSNSKKATKVLGTGGIIIVQGLCVISTVILKEDKPWSNLPVFWDRYVVLKAIPKKTEPLSLIIPTMDWATKQHIDTEVPIPMPSTTLRAQQKSIKLPTAYVSIDQIEVGLLHNRTTLGLNIYVKNTTTVPAKNEVGIFQVLAIPTNEAEKVEDRYPSKITLEKSWEDFEKSRSLWKKMGTNTLGPGEGAWGTGSIENIDDQLWGQLNSGDKVILVMHVVLFTDDTGPHEIDSCRWIQPPFTFEHQTWRFCSVRTGIKY